MDKKSLNLLLIEDDFKDVKIISAGLQKIKSSEIKIDFVSTLMHGIALLKEKLYNAILLDLGLPDSYGLGTIKKIRDEGIIIPIIVLTGFDKQLGEKALEFGAQAFISKSNLDFDYLLDLLYEECK